jgi:hypothetical protein
MPEPKTIKIDDVEYIRKDSIPSLDNNENYSIIRTQSAGVHAGYLQSTNIGNGSVVLKNARRIWYWDGAASLSQLALEGVSKPENCKFSVVVPEITLLGVIEIIPCTISALKNISQVKVWKS